MCIVYMSTTCQIVHQEAINLPESGVSDGPITRWMLANHRSPFSTQAKRTGDQRETDSPIPLASAISASRSFTIEHL